MNTYRKELNIPDFLDTFVADLVSQPQGKPKEIIKAGENSVFVKEGDGYRYTKLPLGITSIKMPLAG